MYLHNATSPSLVYSNTNGKPVASFYNVQTIDTASSYTITNNKITSVKYGGGYRYAISYTGNDYDVITETDANNDVITRTFTYGTKKSPFYVGGFKWFQGDYPPYSQLQGQNEVIKRVDENSGATGTFTFVYEYNADSYPIQATDYENGVLTGYQIFKYIAAN